NATAALAHLEATAVRAEQTHVPRQLVRSYGNFLIRLQQGRGLLLTPAALRQHITDIGVIGWKNDHSLAGNGAHQMVELTLNSRQIREDIAVVEFQIIEDR